MEKCVNLRKNAEKIEGGKGKRRGKERKRRRKKEKKERKKEKKEKNRRNSTFWEIFFFFCSSSHDEPFSAPPPTGCLLRTIPLPEKKRYYYVLFVRTSMFLFGKSGSVIPFSANLSSLWNSLILLGGFCNVLLCCSLWRFSSQFAGVVK